MYYKDIFGSTDDFVYILSSTLGVVMALGKYGPMHAFDVAAHAKAQLHRHNSETPDLILV